MHQDDEPEDENNFEFEVLNSEDGRIVTLVCFSQQELNPLEYAEMLRAFADRIDSLSTMAEIDMNSIN